MAHAETKTKLPLDRWARLMGIHPAHFNGVYYDRSPSTCAMPWLQWPWQTADRVGREEVAQAIAQAEADIEAQLGYRLLPAWETDEWRPTVRPYHPELVNLSVTDARGFGQVAFANWGYLVSGGVRAKSPPLEEDAAIAYTDEDGDGYEEIATVGPVPVDVGQDPCEIRIYYPFSNAMIHAQCEDKWEIRPIDVTVVGAAATIRFRREQAVLPEYTADYFPPADDSHLRGVDGAPATPEVYFLEAVDVCRVYNDPQTQVTMMWEPFGSGCACGGTGCQLCAYTTQTGCLIARDDPRHSIVVYKPGTWNADDEAFDSASWTVGREPNLVRLYYYAGWRNKGLACPRVQMDGNWERVVAYYAATLLDRPLCACDNVKSWTDYWQQDLAINTAEQSRREPMEMLDNPFGTTRGAIYAWKRVKDKMSGKAVFA